MALERSSPLPPGAYWVDVSPVDKVAFDRWLRDNAGAVAVRATNQSADGWQWVRFDVTAPAMVFWNGPGYPTITSAAVTHENEVKQVPRPESPSVDPGAAAGEAIKRIAPWALAGLFGVTLIKRIVR